MKLDALALNELKLSQLPFTNFQFICTISVNRTHDTKKSRFSEHYIHYTIQSET